MSNCSLTGRSFRLQFRADADVRRGACLGRIEHLRSGDAAHFGSMDELLSFVAFWLERQERSVEADRWNPA